jgi:hypothetical protein
MSLEQRGWGIHTNTTRDDARPAGQQRQRAAVLKPLYGDGQRLAGRRGDRVRPFGTVAVQAADAAPDRLRQAPAAVRVRGGHACRPHGDVAGHGGAVSEQDAIGGDLGGAGGLP